LINEKEIVTELPIFEFYDNETLSNELKNHSIWLEDEIKPYFSAPKYNCPVNFFSKDNIVGWIFDNEIYTLLIE